MIMSLEIVLGEILVELFLILSVSIRTILKNFESRKVFTFP